MHRRLCEKESKNVPIVGTSEFAVSHLLEMKTGRIKANEPKRFFLGFLSFRVRRVAPS